MLILNEDEIARLLTPADALAAMRSAFAAQAAGSLSMPLRTIAATAHGMLGAMPAALGGSTATVGAKLVTLFPKNGELGLPTHNAVIVLFDPDTGRPQALLDGRYITEVRTAATSALATSLLARADARTLAVLGTGVQARAHIEALAGVMQIDELRIWGRNAEHARTLSSIASERGIATRTFSSLSEACHGAAVICTVTMAREPVLHAEDVAPGTHVNAVGFGGPQGRELSGELMAKASIFIDSQDGAARESGNLHLARKDGHVRDDQKLTLLCDVLADRARGRQRPDEITVFDSLGIAIEDLACAQLVCARALEAGIGATIAV